jgi:hypothetical protein
MYKLFVFFYFFYLSVNAQYYPNLASFENKSQKQELWCVPASIQMVLNYYRITIDSEQTDIYNYILNKKCSKTTCGCYNWSFRQKSCRECNRAYPIDIASMESLKERMCNHYGLKNTELLSTPITWEKIKTEIDNNFPILFIATGQNGSTLHAFVAFAYQEIYFDSQLKRLIKIQNPYEKCKGCTYWISFSQNGEFIGTEFDTKYVIIPKQ